MEKIITDLGGVYVTTSCVSGYVNAADRGYTRSVDRCGRGGTYRGPMIAIYAGKNPKAGNYFGHFDKFFMMPSDSVRTLAIKAIHGNKNLVIAEEEEIV